jgi:hypothetical protein
MGSFDTTCAISSLPITSAEHTRCYALLVQKTSIYGDSSGPFRHYSPVGMPVEAAYDDYGNATFVAGPAQQWLTSFFGLKMEDIVSYITEGARRFGPRYCTDSKLMQALGYPCSDLTPDNIQKMGMTITDTNHIAHPALSGREEPHFPVAGVAGLHQFFWFTEALDVTCHTVFPSSTSNQNDSVKGLQPYFALKLSTLQRQRRGERARGMD